MAVIPIQIISDTICPWCYIGYHGLQQTIRIYQKTYPGGSTDQFKITWKPYFIDQVVPIESELIRDRMLRRMGDIKQVEAALGRLKRAGDEVNLQLKFGGFVGSSRLSHQVLYMVGERKGSAMQCKVAEQLFHYQFEEEEDISNLDIVLEACSQAGLDVEEVRGWVKSGQGNHEVEQEEKRIRAAGTQGVPQLLIGSRLLVGASDFNDFFEALIEARGQQSG